MEVMGVPTLRLNLSLLCLIAFSCPLLLGVIWETTWYFTIKVKIYTTSVVEVLSNIWIFFSLCPTVSTEDYVFSRVLASFN